LTPRHALIIKNNTTRGRPLHWRASISSWKKHRQDSSDDDSNLSDSDSDSESDSSGEDNGCFGDDEPNQSCSNATKNIPWNEIDEQRLREHREEGKPWKWIFKQFPTRTEPAIRTRWTIIQSRS
jgi:hypothetical protein